MSDVEDFKGAMVAYVQRHDLGRFVDGRVTDDGDWRLIYRDHTGRLQQRVLSDKELQPGGSAAEECSCAHTHPGSVPSLPCPKHGTTGGGTIATLRRLASQRSLGMAFVPDAVRAMMAEGTSEQDAKSELLSLARAGKIELRPEGGLNRLSPEEKRLTIPGPQGSILSWARVIDGAAEEAAVIYEAAEPGSPIAVEAGKTLRWHRSKKGYEAKGKMGVFEIVRRKPDRRHGILPVVLHISPAAYQFDDIVSAKKFAQKLEDVGPHTRGHAAENKPEAKEAPRPKGAEGGGKTVSRWVHWTEAEGGKTFIGKGQVTGRTYHVMVVVPPVEKRHNRRPSPRWVLLTGTIGTGGSFHDSDSAMLHADKLEADAGSIPHGAESASTDRLKILRALQELEEREPGRPHPMEEVRAATGLAHDEFDRAIIALYAQRRVQLDYNDFPSAAPQKERDAMVRIADVYYHAVSPVVREAARETPTTKVPLVTLERNFKKYAKCTAAFPHPVDGPKQIWALLGQQMNREPQEVFLVVPLNIHDRLSDCPVEIARGARSRVEVDPSLVLQAAIAANADTFCVVHNHPASRPDPSEADIALTHTIAKATGAIDTVKFREHYIISEKGVYSVKAGRMWKR